jgi:hypothetical protein
MKRVGMLILALLLLLDLAEDGFLGNVKFCLPTLSAKIAVTASHNHPDSSPGQGDFHHEPGASDGPKSPRYNVARSVSLQVLPTLQIMQCCHLSSSGGIPL